MSAEIPVQFNLPKDLHKRLKILAAATGKTMRECIVEFVQESLDREEKEAS